MICCIVATALQHYFLQVGQLGAGRELSFPWDSSGPNLAVGGGKRTVAGSPLARTQGRDCESPCHRHGGPKTLFIRPPASLFTVKLGPGH